MNKKICVYAIAKNEIKFIERWYESVKEADYICVLDTGSSDGTYEKFKELGIIVKQKSYDNFRFDEARNDSMELIPEDADICVCIDIDEYFEPGWTKLLKVNWNENTGRVRYRYTWNFNPDGSEGIVFMADKIHKNKCFKWKNPVHEILVPTTNKILETIDIPQIQLNHKADNTKSRASYLPLLELSVKENPNDDRNTHYLAREYMFHKEYDKAIEMFIRHLNLPSAIWDIERAASLRYIANCYRLKGDGKNQEAYQILAILEADYVREPYYELAIKYFEDKEYLKSAFVFNQMLKIQDRQINYMSMPECWGSLPYDYLSMCYYELGDYKRALSMVEKAIALNPNEKRLIENKKIFANLINNL